MKLDRTSLMPSEPAPLARQLAGGRAAIAAAILAAPVASARVLGLDTATARRVDWLTRTMAIRDGALAVGGVLAARGDARAAVPWLLAGAAADTVDAVVLGRALRQGRIKGLLPRTVAVLAAGTAGVGAVTALRLRRR